MMQHAVSEQCAQCRWLSSHKRAPRCPTNPQPTCTPNAPTRVWRHAPAGSNPGHLGTSRLAYINEIHQASFRCFEDKSINCSRLLLEQLKKCAATELLLLLLILPPHGQERNAHYVPHSEHDKRTITPPD